MIIEILAELEKPYILKDNKPFFVSLFKNVVSKNNPELFDKLYADKNPVFKNFCFAVKLNNPKFVGDLINLDGNDVRITISTNDFFGGVELYNAFINQRGEAFPMPKNSLTIRSARIENHKVIKENSILIQFLSPIIVRSHNQGEADKYYVYGDDEFKNTLNAITVNQLGKLAGIQINDGDFELVPVKPKTTVIKSFGVNIRCTLGIFKLSASPEILNELYQMGIGSRRSEGNGLFKILD